MSYGLSVFRVPQAMLDRACGKKDMGLFEEALAALEGALADYDEQMDAPNYEDHDADLSHADALREIFTGQFTEGVAGARYGWALECLCDFLGDRLDNRKFSPCDVKWYERLDNELGQHGVPLRFADLIYRAPVPIPEADDWPCVGHWKPQDLAAAVPLAELLPRIHDAEVQEALATALGWLRTAAESGGSLIVGFQG